MRQSATTKDTVTGFEQGYARALQDLAAMSKRQRTLVLDGGRGFQGFHGGHTRPATSRVGNA